MSQSIPGNLYSLHCLDFQAEDRLTPQWHVGQPCGKASWESLVGKPGGKASWESLVGKPRGTGLWESLEGKPRGKASWESLVGKPRGNASRLSLRSLDPREGKCDPAATARKESAHACPHSRRGLTPLGRLPKYPNFHVSTGEESSGSGTASTQGHRPHHRPERNPEKTPSNSHGDWPFLRKPVRVPEVTFVSREHLPQLEKIEEVLPSRRDEAHFH